MDLHLRLAGERPLQEDLYRQLKEAILDGRLRAGANLPASRALAAELGIARNTVLHAYQQLAAEGFLAGRAGAGTFVRAEVLPMARRRAPAGGRITPRKLPEPLGAPPPPAWAPRFDFRIGAPDPALFPWDEWRRLIARQLRRRPPVGGYLPPEGDPRARAAIARHIGLSRSVRAGEEDVLITSGAQQALDLIGRVLISPGDVVAMEDPGYLPARRLFQWLGARVVPVPVDAEGIVVDALPAEARLVYVTPSHQFPLGMPMSLARRQALLAWSERTGAAIVEDDYDSELRFDGRPLEPLQSLDGRGRVLYVGTFSKVLLPSLRLGFLVAPARLMPTLREAKQLLDSHGAPAPQRALASFIDEGLLARHLRRILRVYGERRERLLSAIERHLRGRVSQVPSVAGLHHSLLFRDAGDDPQALALRARGMGVAIELLGAYHQRPSTEGIALGYGLIPATRIDEGIRRLAACLAAP